MSILYPVLALRTAYSRSNYMCMHQFYHVQVYTWKIEVGVKQAQLREREGGRGREGEKERERGRGRERDAINK